LTISNPDSLLFLNEFTVNKTSVGRGKILQMLRAEATRPLLYWLLILGKFILDF
jgi:hypothetical protein